MSLGVENLQERRISRRGFTLIEMIVLIMIMAVVSSIAVPTYARFHAKAKFDHTVQELVGSFAWARDTAIQTGSDATVRYDPQTGVFAITVDQPSVTMDAPAALQSAQDVIQTADFNHVTVLGEDVIVTDIAVGGQSQNNQGGGQTRTQAGEFSFHEDGSCDGARMVVRSQDGYSSLIEVLPLTGSAVVSDE